jgi:hypothetical protein
VSTKARHEPQGSIAVRLAVKTPGPYGNGCQTRCQGPQRSSGWNGWPATQADIAVEPRRGRDTTRGREVQTPGGRRLASRARRGHPSPHRDLIVQQLRGLAKGRSGATNNRLLGRPGLNDDSEMAGRCRVPDAVPRCATLSAYFQPIPKNIHSYTTMVSTQLSMCRDQLKPELQG